MRRLAFLWREIFVTAIELFRYWAVAIVRTVVETRRSSLNLQSIWWFTFGYEDGRFRGTVNYFVSEQWLWGRWLRLIVSSLNLKSIWWFTLGYEDGWGGQWIILLLSSGCEDGGWNQSFHRWISKVFDDLRLDTKTVEGNNVSRTTAKRYQCSPAVPTVGRVSRCGYVWSRCTDKKVWMLVIDKMKFEC